MTLLALGFSFIRGGLGAEEWRFARHCLHRVRFTMVFTFQRKSFTIASLFSAASFESVITRLQPGTLAIAGGPCALSERRLEPDISPNRRNSFLDTGALMVRLTEPRPRTELRRRGELLHVCA